MRLNASRTSKRRVSGSEPKLLLFYYGERGPKKTFLEPTAQTVEHLTMGVALPATRPSAAVAEKCNFDQNVAPAQQRNS